MKRKKVSITVLLAVMVVMTGLAAATEQINVYLPGTITEVGTIQLIPGGAPVVEDLNVSQLPSPSPEPHTFTTAEAVTYNPGGATSSDINVTYQSPQGIGPYGPSPYTWLQTAAPGSYQVSNVKFAASPSAPAGAKYQIQITDTATGNVFTVSVLVDATTTTIPEFPAVAMPVGAAIGLVLLFQYKKKKEE